MLLDFMDEVDIDSLVINCVGKHVTVSLVFFITSHHVFIVLMNNINIHVLVRHKSIIYLVVCRTVSQ